MYFKYMYNKVIYSHRFFLKSMKSSNKLRSLARKGGYMFEKTIIFIGCIDGYVELIEQALKNGCRVLYAYDFGSRYSIIKQERLDLVIINEVCIDINHEDRDWIASLIISGVSVMLIGNNNFKDIFIQSLPNQGSLMSKEAEFIRMIIADPQYLWNKNENAYSMENFLICRYEEGLISFEPNINGNNIRVGWKIKRAIVFMEQNYSNEISIEHISHAAFLSPYHFCRLFKKQTGTTCIKYLSNLRINKAKKMLKETDISITEICYEVGYNSLTHFERVFKYVVGMAPITYRHLC